MKSLIGKSLALLMLWSFSLGVCAAEKLNVVFINPGKSSATSSSESPTTGIEAGIAIDLAHQLPIHADHRPFMDRS